MPLFVQEDRERMKKALRFWFFENEDKSTTEILMKHLVNVQGGQEVAEMIKTRLSCPGHLNGVGEFLAKHSNSLA